MGGMSLLHAVKAGDVSKIRRVLQAGEVADVRDINEVMALMWASDEGHHSALKVLLEAGAVVDLKDYRGGTALTYACADGHEVAMRVLLEAGAAVDSKDEEGGTALMLASSNGQEGAVRVLLEAGAVVDSIDNNGFTALGYAIAGGHESAMRVLLEAGAVLDSKSQIGRAGLMLVSAKGHTGAVQVLREASSKVDSIAADGRWAGWNGQGGNPLGLLTLLRLLCLGLPLLRRRLLSPGSTSGRPPRRPPGLFAKRNQQRQKTKRAKPVSGPAQALGAGPAPSGADPQSHDSFSQVADAKEGAVVAEGQKAAAEESSEAALRVGEGSVSARVGRRASQASDAADERGGAEEEGRDVAILVVGVSAEQVLHALEAAGSDGEVGEGGFGKVVAAELPSMAARWGRVAVKVASGLQTADILMEVATLRLCSHPNVLPLLGYCDDARAPCMITPLMHGGSLDDRLVLSSGALERLRRLGFEGDACLDWQQRLSALCDAARGLAHLHGQRILHRDVKTANILLEGALRPLPTAHGPPLLVYRAVLSDVGLAKVHEPTLGGTTTHATTRNLAFMMGFVDPSLVNSNQHSEKTDAFGIGISILMSLVSEPAAGLVSEREDDVCEAMEDGTGPLFGTAHAVASWPSDVTRALAAVVHGLSIASKRRRQPLPEALVQMQVLLGALAEAAGGEDAPVVGAASAVSRSLVSSRGASVPPVREDEPGARAAASAQPEGWSGGELTRMVRQLELGDADAPLTRMRERVAKAYDSMMVRLERAYAGQGLAPLPTDEQELRKIDLLAPRHLGRLNGLAHKLRKWWNAAKYERDQWAHPPSDREVQRLVRDVIAELDGLGW